MNNCSKLQTEVLDIVVGRYGRRLRFKLNRHHPQFRNPLAGAYNSAYCDFLVSRNRLFDDFNALLMLRDNVDVAEQVRVLNGCYRRWGINTIEQARRKGYLLPQPNPERGWH